MRKVSICRAYSNVCDRRCSCCPRSAIPQGRGLSFPGVAFLANLTNPILFAEAHPYKRQDDGGQSAYTVTVTETSCPSQTMKARSNYRRRV